MEIINALLHIDTYIISLIASYGVLIYLILFLIIFAETGLIITPFLPGDSLLFVAGTIAGQGSLNVVSIFILLSLAAILGDSLNYALGNYLGERFFVRKKLIKQEHLERTKEFYRKHGGKTIILARFMPIIRTFAPFIAGVGKMDYRKFLSFNIIGGLCWVSLFVLGGYFFGTIPIVKNNLTLIIVLIIITSFIPPIINFLKHGKNE
ncbi:DedA family protein [Candidatus Pacearchaeota archaeon]|nr:DedA family protein [Candidatus Pacearchaeota archaeon]